MTRPPKERVRVVGLADNATVEIAPDQRQADLQLGTEDLRVGIFDWIPQGDGTYKPVARIHEKEVPLSDQTLRDLGLGVQPKTLRRLVRAGFVRGSQVAPRSWSFSVQSFIDHYQRCSLDPEFWEEGHTNKNRARYIRVLDQR